MENLDENNLSYDENDILGYIFFNKYHCIEKIGEGSFGIIYKAEYNNNYYALKFEKKDSNHALLENEAVIMDYLKGPYIPYVKSYGTSSSYNILVMQLLGKSLENIFSEKKLFSLKTVCMLGYQFVSILEYIHNRHFLHRDIKPDNFVMGLNELSQYVYILDFGLAKKYRSSRTLKQFPFVNRNKITGTARYASINSLRGYEQSRRDDLEGVVYVLIYFLKGKLPWQGIEARTKEERYKRILNKKLEISTKELCDGLPEEIEIILDYAKNMEYLEQPNYERLRGYFNTILRKEHLKFDYIYDWTTQEDRLKRRVITPKSEFESTQNKKSTFATFKNNGDSKDEVNDIYLSIKNSNSNLKGNNHFNAINNNNIIKEEINQNDSIFNIQTSKNNNEENYNIIIPQRKKHITDKLNEEETCCTSGCKIY